MKHIHRYVFVLFLFPLPIISNASEKDPWTWDEVRFGGIVEQGLDNSCGLASLLTIMQTHFGDERYNEGSLLRMYMESTDEASIAESLTNGLSLLEIEKLAKILRYTTVKKILTLTDLERLVSFVPALVYLEVGKFRHFAVVRGINDTHVLLGDPSRGNVEYSRNEFMTEWKTLKGYPEKTGVALIIIKDEGVFSQKLLKEPSFEEPLSFIEMQRQMRR